MKTFLEVFFLWMSFYVHFYHLSSSQELEGKAGRGVGREDKGDLKAVRA